MTEIIANIDIPFQFAELIESTCENIPVKQVIISAFVEEIKPGIPPLLGAYDAINQRIIIDVGQCLHEATNWTKKGCRLVAAVWLNMVVTLYHEATHAKQLQEEPELIQFDKLPEEYESEAVTVAEQKLLDWAENGGIVPRIGEMGWAEKPIMEILNKMYTSAPDLVLEELRMEGTTAAAEATRAAKLIGDIEVYNLIYHIKNGYVGTVLDDKCYLTIYDIICTNDHHTMDKPQQKETSND